MGDDLTTGKGKKKKKILCDAFCLAENSTRVQLVELGMCGMGNK